MAQPPTSHAAPASAEAAEAAFYEALQRGDLDALMRLWSDDDEPVCVHPGGPRLVGVAAIRHGFEQVLADGALQVFPERVVRTVALGCAVHNVLERVQLADAEDGQRYALVLATNVYLKGPDGWRLVLHHASPATAHEAAELLAQHERLH
jgi:ketosteroid isomerase-like protein